MPVIRRFLIAAVCILTAPLNRAHGQTELYADVSENQFSLLRNTASATGFDFGGRYGVLSWLALDVGYADFGKVNGAFPLGAIYLPGSFTVVPIVLSPLGPVPIGSGGAQTTGPDSLHVDAREAYLLPELRCSFGTLLSGSLGLGLARFESKIGSNFYQSGMVGTAPGTWWETYAGTRRSWTGLGRATLRAAVSRSWSVEGSVHLTSAPAFNSYEVFGGLGNNPFNRNQRLQILGVALGLSWRFPIK